MKAYGGSGGTVRLVLNLGTWQRWVVSITCWLLFSLRKVHLLLHKRLGGLHSQSGHNGVEKNLLNMVGIDPQYRLHIHHVLLEVSPGSSCQKTTCFRQEGGIEAAQATRQKWIENEHRKITDSVIGNSLHWIICKNHHPYQPVQSFRVVTLLKLIVFTKVQLLLFCTVPLCMFQGYYLNLSNIHILWKFLSPRMMLHRGTVRSCILKVHTAFIFMGQWVPKE